MFFQDTEENIKHNTQNDDTVTTETSEENPESTEEVSVITSEKEKSKRRKRSKQCSPDEDEQLFRNALQVLHKQSDEYDCFGNYVAMELRSLKHDFSRRKLKSEIRKTIVRIADEDDYFSIPSSSSTASSHLSIPSPNPSPVLYQQPSTQIMNDTQVQTDSQTFFTFDNNEINSKL